MVEHVNKYETIFIIDVNKTDDERDAIIEKFKSLISSNGEIESVEEWGKKRLAYPINDMLDGFYMLINFTADPDFPKELDRVFGITDGLMRSIIVRKEEKNNAKVEEKKPAVAE